jgi:hypothetical protein
MMAVALLEKALSTELVFLQKLSLLYGCGQPGKVSFH